MSHIYEDDTKPILSDPPYLLQFILAVVLSVALRSDHHVHVELVRCSSRTAYDWSGASAGA